VVKLGEQSFPPHLRISPTLLLEEKLNKDWQASNPKAKNQNTKPTKAQPTQPEAPHKSPNPQTQPNS
jgi:hypothetical protein